MQILPAVDILSGRCVQLVGGDRSTAKEYGTPLENALRWIDAGASALHVVNLDGAFSASLVNVSCIREILAETDVFCEVGGGIRSIADAKGWLDAGVSRIIISTFAVQNPQAIADLAGEYGSERIMAGIDARGTSVSVAGWTKDAGNYLDWARRFEELGAGSLLYTNIDVEGQEKGINPEPVKNLLDAVSIPVIISGGITSKADVVCLRNLGTAGIVLGSALYSGKITLKEAMEQEE